MDKIIIKGLEIFAFHGVNPEEKRDGQTFVIDAVLHTNTKSAAMADDLDKTVNYAKAVKLINKVMTDEVYDLIETAAEKVASALLGEFDKINAVLITLKKPQAPIKAKFDYVAVEIYREK